MEVKMRKSVRNFVGDEMINPVPPAVHEDAALTLSILEPLFQGFQQVFVGDMNNIAELDPDKEANILEGFLQLERRGWITIDDDGEFTPTQAYFKTRVQKTSKRHLES